MNYINTETLDYPLTEQAIRAAHPDYSPPTPFQSPTGYAPVFEAPKPAHDAITQVARELAPVLTDKGHWQQQWEVASRFADYTDATGVLHTKIEQERAAILADQTAKTESLQGSIVSSIQHRLDAFAKTRNYDGILSACTYATSTVPKFQTEGQYCVNARDATWSTMYQIFDDVTNGVKPMPASFADIEHLLPVLEWPL